MRERLAGLTSFAGGRALALALAPSPDPADGRGALRRAPRRRCSCATAASAGRAARSTCATRPARRPATRCSSAETLAEVLATVRRVARAARGGGRPAEERAAPGRDGRVAADVGAARRVEAALARALDPRGGLLDTASPSSRSVRRAARRGPPRRRRPAARPRRAPPLPPAGVVHHRARRPAGAGGEGVVAVARCRASSTTAPAPGETIFVEPMALVEANNAGPRARGPRRPRSRSASCGCCRGWWGRSATRPGRGDRRPRAARPGAGVRRPVARVATAARWSRPREVDLRAARHPLLDPATAVPIDLPLAGIRALVVSGPNTGGKTVALKTLGLLAMLHQCGLRVPAAAAAPAGVRPGAGRHRRRPVDRREPVHLLGPRAAAHRDHGGRRRRGRWCCSTSPPPAPTPTRAPAWPRP